MNLMSFAFAVILAAPPAFPAPRIVEVTPQMVCAWGPVLSKDGSSTLVVSTPAGPFTTRIGGSTKLIGLNGKELRGIGDLQNGTHVRVYYVVDDGARAAEIDVIPAPAAGATEP